jgi:hypothetical protein
MHFFKKEEGAPESQIGPTFSIEIMLDIKWQQTVILIVI